MLFVFLVVTIWTLRTGQATPDLSAYSWLYLRDAGFNILELVNNHALNFGPAGLAETVSRLQEAGIATVGVGPNRRLGFACDSQTVRLSSVEACRPVNVPQVPKTGPFRTGAIDLTGDGVQELIMLEERGDGCAVTVWRWHGWGFSLMWRSPPGRYRDLALITGGADHPPIISVAVES